MVVNGVEVVIRGKRDDNGEYLAPLKKFFHIPLLEDLKNLRKTWAC
jgi:hypothetical protein